MTLKYWARFRKSDKEIQALSKHLQEVATLAAKRGMKFGIAKICYIAGLLHDMGKYDKAFQENIRISYDGGIPPTKENHSNYGAEFLYKMHLDVPIGQSNNHATSRKYIVEMIGNAIFGHHSQLDDFISLNGEKSFENRLNKDLLKQEVVDVFYTDCMNEQDFKVLLEAATNEFLTNLQEEVKLRGKDFNLDTYLFFISNLIFSILVDADRTNAQQFDTKYQKEEKHTFELFNEWSVRIEDKLISFNMNPQTPITLLRNKIADDCLLSATKQPGVWRLSTPVGGGKTISSLRYGINHALHHKKERIFYILPFTTVIEQNAEEVRQILDAKDALLEHHSNVFEELDLTNEYFVPVKDNWDSPLIFTTMYQFLMTAYGGRARFLRRFSYLANSVIILDEVQALPTKTVNMFNAFINFLAENLNCTILLCTATQPTLDLLQKGIRNVHGDIAEITNEIYDGFKRVNIVDACVGGAGYGTKGLFRFIHKKIIEHDQMLIILNTKKVVRDLYQMIKFHQLSNEKTELDDIPLYHLSTDMCPKHRFETLAKIHKHLNKGEKVLVISTPLIEAGVNISFKSVVRSLTTMDSIAQASGRCNRHGEIEEGGTLYIINHYEEFLDHMPTIEIGGEVTSNMLYQIKNDTTSFGEDILKQEAIRHFFLRYYTRIKNDLDYPIPDSSLSLYHLLFNPKATVANGTRNYKQMMRTSFRSAADIFEVYETNQIQVLAPYSDYYNLVDELVSGKLSANKFFKRAQRYMVNIFESSFDVLLAHGFIDSHNINGNTLYILAEDLYTSEYGVIDLKPLLKDLKD